MNWDVLTVHFEKRGDYPHQKDTLVRLMHPDLGGKRLKCAKHKSIKLPIQGFPCQWIDS